VKHPVAHIFDFTPESLQDWCQSRGMAAFRAKQILEWVYAKGVCDAGAMTNLSASDRDLIAHPTQGLTFLSGHIVRHQRASDDTQKLLIQWDDSPQAASAVSGTPLPIIGSGAVAPDDPSRQTECVMIPSEREETEDNEDEDVPPTGEGAWSSGGRGGPIGIRSRGQGRSRGRGWGERAGVRTRPGPSGEAAGGGRYRRRTACISSQVGCPVGCRFCASGLGGLDANLSAGRIVEQVWRLGRLFDQPATPTTPRHVGRITNVVFMGMGEPLSNFGAVMHAVRTLNAPWGLNISARKITISTVGLPAAIERLSRECDLPVTLALSLHAPNDALRRELIPWAEYTSIADLLGACRQWFDKTGREITLEYILLGGVNDRPTHAHELAGLARTLRANVNLIRYNEVSGIAFARPKDADVLAFQQILRGAGVNTHIRASRGRDIAAACGQLRHEKSGPASAIPKAASV